MNVTAPQPGAIAFVQRFGSSLNLHPHIHAIVPDAVFTRADDGSVAQIPLPTQSPADLAHLAHRMAIRVHRMFAGASERGPFAELAAGAGDEDDDEQAALTASLAEAMPRQLAFDAGNSTAAGRQKDRATDAAYVGGVSLHISKAIAANKRDRLERLLRYGARPPLASSRLTQTPNGKVAYELRRPSHTGQTHVVLAPVPFLRRLAALMRPPHRLWKRPTNRSRVATLRPPATAGPSYLPAWLPQTSRAVSGPDAQARSASLLKSSTPMSSPSFSPISASTALSRQHRLPASRR